MTEETDIGLVREISWKLWDLANGVTGFAVLQCVALLFAMGADETFRSSLNTRLGIFLVTFCTLAISIGQVSAVRWTRDRSLQLLPNDDPLAETWRQATRGRILTIVVFSFLVVISASAIFLRAAVTA